MIILHNKHDETSRNFVEQFGDGHYVIDWYSPEGQAEWVAAGGTLEIQGFPAILIQEPTYVEPEFVNSEGQLVPEKTIPSKQVVLGCLANMVDVGQRVAKINQKLRDSKNKPGNININTKVIPVSEDRKKVKTAQAPKQ